jgi:hypothetical protein
MPGGNRSAVDRLDDTLPEKIAKSAAANRSFWPQSRQL